MILGINDSHDAGVAVITHRGEILFAANEERYTGRKLQTGFPTKSLEHAFSYLKPAPSQVTDIAFGFRGLIEPESNSLLPMEKVGVLRKAFTAASALAGPLMETGAVSDLIQAAAFLMRRNRGEIAAELSRLGLAAPIRYVRHHEAHAASAYMTSGFDNSCVITIDAGGDGLSGALWHGRSGKLELLDTLPRIHSLGDFWLAVTLLCGFHPDRHGGKITGLAAYQPCPEALTALRSLYEPVESRFLIRNREYLFWKRLVARLRKTLAPFNREEIAWAAQRLLEELVLHLVRQGIERTGESRLSVAGGVFANVRLNMEILQLPECTGFFVHPHMGDGGCALGAALALATDKYGAKPRTLTHAFYGNPAGEVPDSALDGLDVSDRLTTAGLAKKTAKLLADDKVVGVVMGRMEYGPRALTHRSILYHPFDAGVMDWLNDRLDRTEFMPFAPVLAREKGALFFEMAEKGALASQFMTVCLPATARTRKEAPAIVHIDGTARPQFVLPEQTPFIHALLGEFEQLTGVPVLINTSFNRHEQPIVATALQAVDELRHRVVDVLVLEDRIVRCP